MHISRSVLLGVRHDLLLLAAVLLVVVAGTIAGYNDLTPLHIGADYRPERVLRGFHEVEHDDEGRLPFRWTGGTGTVCLEQVGYAPRHLVHVTLLGKGASALGINEVTFLVDDQPVTTAQLRPAMQNYTLLIDGRQRQHDNLCITITSKTTRATADYERREFGVPFLELVFYRSTTAGLVLPALWHLSLNLAAAAVTFWLLRLSGLRAWLSALLVGSVALITGVAVAGNVLDPGMDAARNLAPTVSVAFLLLVGSLSLRLLLSASFSFPPGSSSFLLLKRDLAAMLIWSGVLWGSVRILQASYGPSGVWPLKAGIWPGFTPMVLIAVAAFGVWLALVVRGLVALLLSRLPEEQEPKGVSIRPEGEHKWRPHLFSALLFVVLIGAWALPLLLRTSVRGWDSLFWTFSNSPSDYILDVPRVGNPLTFLGHYVALSPTLAWHNSNHPPGSVLLLWLVEQAFGPGPVSATWVAILLSGLVAVAAFWLGWRLGGPTIALLSGALMVAMPGHQIYSVTSMDGVFNAINALAAVAFFLALEPGSRPIRAALAGMLLALGLFFTYATTQLLFFGLAVCLLRLISSSGPLSASERGRRPPWLPGTSWFVLRQGAIAVAVLGGIYLLVYVTTGFNIVAASIQAKANNARLLLPDPTTADPTLLGLPTTAHYVYYLAVNIVPFAWYLAPWGLAALTPIVIAGRHSWQSPKSIDVLAVSVVVLVMGMLFSGLFVREVERIWGFVYPLAAVLMASHIWQGETPSERLWRAGLFVTLFFAQSTIMRMLLNTYW